MFEHTSVEIKVPEHGELRDSVKQRLRRVRDAFSEAKTHAAKQEALEKLLNSRAAGPAL